MSQTPVKVEIIAAQASGRFATSVKKTRKNYVSTGVMNENPASPRPKKFLILLLIRFIILLLFPLF